MLQSAWFNFLATKGLSVSKPLRLHDESVAVLGKQTKKHKPLVPEYHRIVTVAAGKSQPANSKLLPPHFRGNSGRDEAAEQLDAAMDSADN